MDKNRFLNSRWFYRLISLIFAILLFAYVNQSKLSNFSKNSNNDQNITQLSSSRSDKVSVPLQLNVDNTKYFITGYPEKVNVKLTGPAALVTTTVNTQNFKVYADLSKLGVGHHKVRLSEDGINSELKNQIQPSTIDVNIKPRQTTTLPVDVNYNKDNISPGYNVGKIVNSNHTAKVTGADSEIKKIDKIIAQVSLPQNVKDTVNTQAVLEAVDNKGRTVNVIVTPSTATINLPITSGNNKTVPLNLRPTNGSSNNNYDLISNHKEVQVFGDSKQLSKIKKVEANVDVSNVMVNHSKTKEVQLDRELNQVSGFNPDSIKVDIHVKSKS